MNILYIIPARGGSKGIPNKNIKLLAGKPLIQYTIDAARQVASDENICVSTDSSKIKNVCEEVGLNVPFLRPSELATDKAPTEQLLKHAITFYENQGIQYDYVVLLQPTSPFRSGVHIEEAIREISSEIDMVVSVKATSSNPYYVLYEEEENGLLKKSKEGGFTRRQDCPIVYELNGAIYVINVSSLMKGSIIDFKKIIKYEMKHIESLDIDEPLDWYTAEMYLNKKLV